MIQLVSLAAAVLLLAAYAGNQTGRLTTESLGYSMANMVASGILAAVALIEAQWGFLLLEGAWCAISTISVARSFG